MEKCRCDEKCTCGEKWKEEYEEYLEEQKCIDEKNEAEEMSKPDNTYGLNPIACQVSRNRVYLNYYGLDKPYYQWMKDKE